MKRWLLAIAALASACAPVELPPEGQIRLFIDTDAILPPAVGEDDGGQMALFDRLRIEIFPPGESVACAGCTREIGIDHRIVFEGRASIGIVPPPGEGGRRARIRLYRSTGADSAEPRPTSMLEAVVALPAVEAEGIVDVHVVLRTDDLGTPQGTLDAPIAAQPGPAEGGLAGTWAAAARRGCAGAPADGEVCVPGGAFWMGDPSFIVPTERLVVLSPYWLDATEVTVARFRAAGFVSPLAHGSGAMAHCTFTKQPGAFEDLPLSCLTRPLAQKFCEAKGGALVSEAQWEMAASARRSAPFVWGSDTPRCEDAVIARLNPSTGLPGKCKALGVDFQLPGAGLRDRLELEGGTIVDLMGNLIEWMRDDWATDDEPCWSAPILHDPVCESDGHPLTYSIRGSGWAGTPARASEREFNEVSMPNVGSMQIGFRCARSVE
ncbi:Adenylate cyclase [Minicystis rosea]|nr:Adenylate cyclase [Minicystis rosea]